MAVPGVLALVLTGGTLGAAAELVTAFFTVSAITAFRALRPYSLCGDLGGGIRGRGRR